MDLLHVLNFPPNMLCWIEAFVSTPRFSINFNGESIGYFSGRKGLRQGDPISPFLFVIVMDFLRQLIRSKTVGNPNFDLH